MDRTLRRTQACTAAAIITTIHKKIQGHIRSLGFFISYPADTRTEDRHLQEEPNNFLQKQRSHIQEQK